MTEIIAMVYAVISAVAEFIVKVVIAAAIFDWSIERLMDRWM